MQVDQKFFDLLESFEGFVRCPYYDSVKIPTIGIGTTVYPNGKKVRMSDVCITYEQALDFVRYHVHPIEVIIEESIPDLNQNQFNALVSLAYNIGNQAFKTSTLAKKARIDPNDPSIPNEFLRWNKAGGKTVKGLTLRRQKESKLYTTPIIIPTKTILKKETTTNEKRDSSDSNHK